MKKTVPGFLYAKALRATDQPGSSYRIWFEHPAFETLSSRVASFRNSFQWVLDASQRHEPVIVVESACNGEHALVVRFVDVGKDTFGRSQTLRMEAFLVPANEAADYLDVSFLAEPDPEMAVWRVETIPENKQTSGRMRRIVVGDPRTFRLEGLTPFPVGTSSSDSSELHNHPKNANKTEPSRSSFDSSIPIRRRRQVGAIRTIKTCFFALMVLFVSSLIGNAIQFIVRQNLEDELVSVKRERDNVKERLSENEADRQRIENFVLQRETLSVAIEKCNQLSNDTKILGKQLLDIQSSIDQLVSPLSDEPREEPDEPESPRAGWHILGRTR